MDVDPILFDRARPWLVQCLFATTPDHARIAIAGAPGWTARLSEPNERVSRALAELASAPPFQAEDGPASGAEGAARAVLAAAHQAGATTLAKHRDALRKGVLAGWKKERVAYAVEVLYWTGLLLSRRAPFTALHSSDGRPPFALDVPIARAYLPDLDLDARPEPVAPPPPPAPAALPLDVDAWRLRVHAVDPDERAMAWRDAARHNAAHEPLPFALLRELHDPRWTNMPLFFDHQGRLVGSRDPAPKPRRLADLALPTFAGAPEAPETP